MTQKRTSADLPLHTMSSAAAAAPLLRLRDRFEPICYHGYNNIDYAYTRTVLYERDTIYR
jgi:hypothetical protein